MTLVITGNFILLALIVVFLGLSTIFNAFLHNTIFGGLISILLLGFLYAYIKEWDFKVSLKFSKNDILIASSVFGGGILTFLLNNFLGLGPVVASALVGIIAAAALGKYSVPAYCGSFVGMASSEVISPGLGIILASILASGVFLVNKPFFNGFGGKLGAIAFSACLLTGLLSGTEFNGGAIPGLEIKALVVLYCLMGALLTNFASVKLKQGPVLASGLIGLVAGLIIPALFVENGGLLASAMFCGSFVGMSSPERLVRPLLVGIAGVLAGLIYIYSLPYLGGLGGKLGTIAFSGVIGIRGLLDFYLQFLQPRFETLEKTFSFRNFL